MTLPVTPSVIVARKAMSLGSRIVLAGARATSRFAGRRVFDPERGNDVIGSLIRSGRPLMVSRLGSSELGAWQAALGAEAMRQGGWARFSSVARGEPSGWTEDILRAICANAGFFPPHIELLSRYAHELDGWVRASDVMAVWFYRTEDRLLRSSRAMLVRPMALEAYVHPHPWTLALAGKRVLVVHPFADSIAAQYVRRHHLFAGKEVLPQFDLVTLRAVQSIAGSNTAYGDWFEALAGMQEQIAGTAFDVALIGAGAYGLPLAAFIKGLGKQAIHMGGSTQVLFGIKGRRWESRPEVSKYFNEHWVRPSKAETPSGAASVENGCYW